MLLSIYGIELDVPKEYFVSITKGSLYFKGDLEVSDHFKHVIRVFWDDLDEFRKIYPSPQDFFEEKVSAIKNDRDLVGITSDVFSWGGADANHPAHFHKISYSTKKRFTKELHHCIIGLVAFCEVCSRRYLLFNEYYENKNEFEETALKILGSFRCRCGKDED
ncbi:MAG: hypothetical protein NQU41_02390 [Candidatus Methanosuratincola sp.]|jgi:hypothetical protein|uniref:Uncharacterized protein n=1 Tax=Candidatus Methanosuratincola petrocarbonis (ex Vanwonterghem et al. 2016) TaxID=1867261 RepID=A0A7J3UZY5_9CREN|nr:hypothetical protein [Candidatus Methanosuratincola sp.]